MHFENSILLISYLSLIVTCVGQYLQIYGQTHIDSDRATLIFSLDPVYSVIFSYIIIDERPALLGNFEKEYSLYFLFKKSFVTKAGTKVRSARSSD